MQSTNAGPSNAVRNVCSQENVTETVVFTVSEATGIDPLEMEPLYDVVDPAALTQLVQGSESSASPDATIRFSMAGCDVIVNADGAVVATPTATENTQANTPQTAD